MMERQVKTNIKRMETDIAKILRDATIQGVAGAIAFLALVAVAFAAGYYLT